MTHLVGSGAGNSTERLWVGNDELSLSQIATDPFKGLGSPSSDRAWDSPTFPLSISGAGGEYAMKVDHGSNSPYDCLTWVAIVSSAIVEDTDKDGLLNEWETDGRYQKITHDSAGNVIDARFGKCTDPSFASDPANCVDFPKMGALAGPQGYLHRVRLHAGSCRNDIRDRRAKGRRGARPSARSRGSGKGGKAFAQRARALRSKCISISETTIRLVRSQSRI